MSFRPLKEDEVREIERNLAILEPQVKLLQQGIADLKKTLVEGRWVSDVDYAELAIKIGKDNEWVRKLLGLRGYAPLSKVSNLLQTKAL